MDKKIILILGILLIMCLSIGGKMYMNKEKDREESLEIQKDLANYVYSNYVLYTKDEEKANKIKEAYNKGNGSLTEEEYLKKMKEVREYVDIEKIKFTGYSITPMNTVDIHFIINDAYEEEVSLDTISAETNKLMYTISKHSGNGPYYIEEKKEKTDKIMPDSNISYYVGEVK